MNDFSSLHPTQERLLNALLECGHVRPPLRTLGKRIGVSSPNTVAYHLKQLERKGYLVPREDGEVELVREPLRDVVYLPLYGNAACGRDAFFADGNVQERIPLPARTLGITAECFLVRARGDSMQPKICDRDLLLVQPVPSVESGQIAVVALDDGVFAKQLLRGRKEIILNSLAPSFAPVVLSPEQHLHILGVVRGVLRQEGNLKARHQGRRVRVRRDRTL